MITINNNIIKKHNNFYSNCLFHPTDAVEDPWGKRILDRMSKDAAVNTIRIYTMFEDIVYLDQNGNLAYDFRLNDLRLDYLLEKGFDILLAYGMMPECIAKNKNATSTVCKNKTRYKGKLINTSVPVDYNLWEEICFEYTNHIIERYGIERVEKWHLQCFNEPDISMFFMSELPDSETMTRAKEYCKLYKAFADGVIRASDRLCIGGPCLANRLDFLEYFLNFVKNSKTRLDYIPLHNYGGTGVWQLCNQYKSFTVERWLSEQEKYMEVINRCGFGKTEIVIDEWGMAAQGFYNIEECPYFIARETEVFSSFFVKLIYKILEKGWNVSKLMICLSGQHEMTTDFSGFRNFFTLNFFAKPIYNAHVLAARLKDGLLECKIENENLFVIPTVDENKNYSVILTYSSDKFRDNLPNITETVCFNGLGENRKVKIWCIDKTHNNPYRLYERLGLNENLNPEEIKMLQEESNLNCEEQTVKNGMITLEFSANSVYLLEVSGNEG